MGIAGLHPLLKSIQKPCHLTKFKGQTLGVDAYGWLHRGTTACAVDLALGRDTKKHIDFVMNRVRMLMYFGVKPYLVFDGGLLPSKAETEEARATRREESRRNGMRLYHAGRVVQAQRELQKAVDVTPYMARLLIEELKRLKVQYVVAPYEADAQLVYLEKHSFINGIVSEDSDMLVFGAKRLLSKLEPHGECIEINRADFTACREISLVGWSDESFRQMCILSGCDYLPSIPGMGLKTAYRYLRKCKSIERVVRSVQFEGKSRVPVGYLDDLKCAELTFLHQRVFCPHARKLTTLTPIPADTTGEETGSMPFIGEDMDDETAVGVACGDLDPMTKAPIEIKQSYPERSRMVLTRRQTLPSATEKRPAHRITSFFTPKRVPLGELNPNSLTPSPSQQQVLEENANRSWESRISPAPTRFTPTPSSRHTATTPAPPRSSQPLPSSSQRQDFLERAAAAAPPQRPPQPSKRQRLCSDADDGVVYPGPATEQRSRFFGPPSTAATNKSTGNSVNAQTKTKTPHVKKARKAEFGIFSDDSVENIMTQLPDNIVSTPGPTEPTKPPQKDEATGPAEETTATQEEEERAATTKISDSPPLPAVADPDLDPTPLSRPVQVPDHCHVERPNLKLREQYAYKPSGEGHSDANARIARPVFHEGRLHGTGGLPGKTPLQRLGEAAVARSKSLSSLAIPKSTLPAHRDRRSSTSRDEGGYESDYTPGRSTLHAPGSEDFIVPDSADDEEEELAETGEQQLPPPADHAARPARFDVQKFAFSPAAPVI